MIKTKKQVLAHKRNSAKWKLTGMLGNIKGMQSDKMFTDAERMQLAPAIAALEEIYQNWNQSNTEFGLKNPDAKEKK